MQTKTERIEARLNSEQKDLFIQAAALEGKSLSDFMVSNAYEAAKRIVQENEILALTIRDRELLVKSLLEDESPNPRLQRAVERYRKNGGRR